MKKAKKIKICLGLFYLIVLSSFLFFLSSKITLEELKSYEFIKNNRDYFFELKQTNLLILSAIFIFFSILWVLMAGFGSPVALLSGFIFGKWLGTVVLILGLSFGATILYIFANYFLKEMIKEKFSNRFNNLEIKFKKSEFIFLLVYRFVGGIPFAIANVLPCLFNVKISNFFWSTLIGLIPSTFLIVSIGSGLEKIIDQNLEAPKLLEILYTPDIYIPMIAFAALIILTIIARKIFYKK
jgi:uncharacterized membrane protein YdjX (TVP38/TMEM64 family)